MNSKEERDNKGRRSSLGGSEIMKRTGTATKASAFKIGRRKSEDLLLKGSNKIDESLFRETSSKRLIRMLLDSKEFEKPQISKRDAIDESIY